MRPPSPHDDATGNDLHEALTVVLARDGLLFTAGERTVLARALRLSPAARSLLARLIVRKARPIALGTLHYASVPDPAAAARELLDAGLLDDEATLTPARRLLALPKSHLVLALETLGLAHRGSRAVLLERLLAAPTPLLSEPLVRLRHPRLFRRVVRLFLYDHEGDLGRLVVARLGLVAYPTYVPTGGPGPFPDRRALLAYEAALERIAAVDEASAPEAARVAVEALETQHPSSGIGRFSARRFDLAIAVFGARVLERSGQVALALSLYERLSRIDDRMAVEVAQRRALCLARLDRAREGAALCRDARDRAVSEHKLALDRTGRRLARKAGLGWVPLPPLQKAMERQIDLGRVQRVAVRPLYRTEDGVAPVEEALVDELRRKGRVALFAESAPWTTLFGLLFRDALFAPVAGALPTQLLTAPLDLGTPEFFARRRRLIEDVLEEIAWGGAMALLDRALLRPQEAIVGVRVDDPAVLRAFCAAVPAPALEAILRTFAERYHEVRAGMPDLVILPGPEIHLDRALPARVDASLVLAEVKGPTDALRDAQRLWFDRLIMCGLKVELWNVRALVAPPDAGYGPESVTDERVRIGSAEE